MAHTKRVFREWQHPRASDGRFAREGSPEWVKAAAEKFRNADTHLKAGTSAPGHPGRPRIARGAKAEAAFASHDASVRTNLAPHQPTEGPARPPAKRRPSTFELGPESKSSSGADRTPERRMAAPGARKPVSRTAKETTARRERTLAAFTAGDPRDEAANRAAETATARMNAESRDKYLELADRLQGLDPDGAQAKMIKRRMANLKADAEDHGGDVSPQKRGVSKAMEAIDTPRGKPKTGGVTKPTTFTPSEASDLRDEHADLMHRLGMREGNGGQSSKLRDRIAAIEATAAEHGIDLELPVRFGRKKATPPADEYERGAQGAHGTMTGKQAWGELLGGPRKESAPTTKLSKEDEDRDRLAMRAKTAGALAGTKPRNNPFADPEYAESQAIAQDQRAAEHRADIRADVEAPGLTPEQRANYDKLLGNGPGEGLVKHKQSRQIVEQLEQHGWTLEGHSSMVSLMSFKAPDGREIGVQFLLGGHNAKPRFFTGGAARGRDLSYKAALAHVVTPTHEEVGGAGIHSARERLGLPSIRDNHSDHTLKPFNDANRAHTGYGTMHGPTKTTPEVITQLRRSAEQNRSVADQRAAYNRSVMGTVGGAGPIEDDNSRLLRQRASELDAVASEMEKMDRERAAYVAERDRRAGLPLDIRPTPRGGTPKVAKAVARNQALDTNPADMASKADVRVAELKPGTEAHRRAAADVRIKSSGPGMTPTLQRDPQPGDLVYANGLNRAGTVVRGIKRNRTEGFDVQWEGQPYTAHHPTRQLQVVDVAEAIRRQQSVDPDKADMATKADLTALERASANIADQRGLNKPTARETLGLDQPESGSAASIAATTDFVKSGPDSGSATNYAAMNRTTLNILAGQAKIPIAQRRGKSNDELAAMLHAKDEENRARKVKALNPSGTGDASSTQHEKHTPSDGLTTAQRDALREVRNDPATHARMYGGFVATNRAESAALAGGGRTKFALHNRRAPLTDAELPPDRGMAKLTDEQLTNGLRMRGTQSPEGKRLQAEAERRGLLRPKGKAAQDAAAQRAHNAILNVDLDRTAKPGDTPRPGELERLNEPTLRNIVASAPGSPLSNAAQVELDRRSPRWIDKATGREVADPGQVGIVRGDIVKADSDAGKAAIASRTARQGALDTRRDMTSTGGASKSPTTEANVYKITAAQAPYTTGRRVEVQVQNFDKPGFPMEWQAGTVDEHRLDDNGRVDMRVKLDKGGFAQRQIIGQRGGNKNVRPIADEASKTTGRPTGGEPQLGVTESSKGRTTTVTLPDGTTAQRTSKTMAYSHAVVATLNLHERAARLRQEATEDEASIEAIQKWFDEGADRSKLRAVPTSGNSYHTSHLHEVPGAPGRVGGTYKGGQPWYRNMTTFLRLETHDNPTDRAPRQLDVGKAVADTIAELRRSIAKDRAAADKLEAGPQHEHYVARWSQRADSAFAAIGTPDISAQDTTYQVVGVGGIAKADAKPAKIIPTAAEKAAAADARKAADAARRVADREQFIKRAVRDVEKDLTDGRDAEARLSYTDAGLKQLAKDLGVKVPRPYEKAATKHLIVEAVRERLGKA